MQNLFAVRWMSSKPKSIKVMVQVSDANLDMELESRVSCSITVESRLTVTPLGRSPGIMQSVW